MPSSSPSLVIYDFGKVVANFDVQHQFDYWQRVSGVSAADLRDRYVVNDNYLAYERGEIDDHAFYSHTAALLGMDISYEDFVSGWNAIFMDRKQDVVECIRRLSGQVRQVLLSNTNALHATRFRTQFAEELALLDAVYVSHEINARKPDAACFEKVLTSEGVAATDSVFFDDLKENVQAGEALGIRAFQVRDDADVRAGLQQVGFSV